MASFASLVTVCLLLLAQGGLSSPLHIANSSLAFSNVSVSSADPEPSTALVDPKTNSTGLFIRDDDASTPVYYLYTLPRLVVYFQTTHSPSTGKPVSMLPLITKQGIALTHIIISAFHIAVPGSGQTGIHLNDNPPDSAVFNTLWSEVKIMQKAGVRVMGMVGGAAGGSFESNTLDSTSSRTFEIAYRQLYNVIKTYGLQGMDLDVEQSMSQAGITRLVRRLNSDFGPQFEVTLAPVASALTDNGPNLSGFSYSTLARTISASSSSRIAFYNAQFYNGFGSMSSPNDYENIVHTNSQFSPDKVLIGQITAPSQGYDYVEPGTLKKTVTALRDHYGAFNQLGGIMGWEYFDSSPGGQSQPWQWAQEMTEILRPGQTPAILMTKSDAQRLTATYQTSAVQMSGGGYQPYADAEDEVDYMAMVNA